MSWDILPSRDDFEIDYAFQEAERLSTTWSTPPRAVGTLWPEVIFCGRVKFGFFQPIIPIERIM